jgi:hypothetical protein
MTVTGFLVIAAALFSAARLGYLAARNGVVSAPLSTPRGSARRGVAYALGAGLSPLAKESARRHLWVFGVGVTFHAGVFAAGAWLVATLWARGAPTAWPVAWTLPLVAGATAGCTLLVRRLQSPLLRSISVPDDVVSNVLSTLFIVAALVTVWAPSLIAGFHLAAIGLLLYAPVGKIRHCVFFFVARARFGALFGHRGSLPPVAQRARP